MGRSLRIHDCNGTTGLGGYPFAKWAESFSHRDPENDIDSLLDVWKYH